jgi:hypothetical protein
VTQSEAPEGLNKAILDLAGVAHEGVSDLYYGYFGRKGVEPAAARGHFANVKPVNGAIELIPVISPLKAGKGGAKFGHGLAPPDRYEGYAAVTERAVGRGKVIYVAMPAFKQYWQNQNPYVSELVLSLVDRLVPRPLARVETKAQVEMVAVRKNNDLIVHLVNHSCRERLQGHWYPVFEYMPVIRNIPVSIRVGDATPGIRSAPAGEEVAYTVQEGYAKLVVPELEFMESVVVKGYFE